MPPITILLKFGVRHGFGVSGVLRAASQNAQFRNSDDKIGPAVGGSPAI
jgi:hypothetical protein